MPALNTIDYTQVARAYDRSRRIEPAIVDALLRGLHLLDVATTLAECRRVARAGAVLQAVVRENLATLWYRHYFPEIDRVLSSAPSDARRFADHDAPMRLLSRHDHQGRLLR